MILSDAVAHLPPLLGDGQPLAHPQGTRRVRARTAPRAGGHRQRAVRRPRRRRPDPVRVHRHRPRPRPLAGRRRLDHRDGCELPLAAPDFFIELKKTPGLSDEVLPVYLEETSFTLAGTCYKLTKPQNPVAGL